MIYVFFISILLLLVLSFILNKKDIISPAFIFTFGFFFQSIWVLLYAKKWELSLNINTFCVIVFGILIFIIVSKLVSVAFKKINKNDETKQLEYIHIDRWKKICLILFSIFACIYYLNFVVTSVGGSIFDFKNISSYISKYDHIVKFSIETIRVPFLVGNIKMAVVAIGYWFLYVLINNIVHSKKVSVLDLLIIGISAIMSILNGSRTPLFFMLAAGIAYAFMIFNIKQFKTKKFNYKLIVTVGVIGIVFLGGFTSFAKLLGRNIKTNPVDYLAIYCGAEVKNLDMFLQEDSPKNTKYFGTQTFRPIITTIGRKIGIKNYEDYKLDLPFRHVGKYNLGNVYTTFYPYIYDFGYIGLVILVAIMAAISQLVYDIAKRNKKPSIPSICSVAYGIVFSCLLLSFFSNKFYENIITAEFLKQIIIWYLCIMFFCKLDLKKIFKK